MKKSKQENKERENLETSDGDKRARHKEQGDISTDSTCLILEGVTLFLSLFLFSKRTLGKEQAKENLDRRKMCAFFNECCQVPVNLSGGLNE